MATSKMGSATTDASGVGRGDVWLLATTDGADWLVDDLEAINSELRCGEPYAAARNGDTVLVAAQDGWLRYRLPGG